MRAIKCFLLSSGLIAAMMAGARAEERSTPDALKAQIESLRAPQVAWRQIEWKSCLLDGLRESRASHKPLLLWVFIDRPVDDERC